MSIISRAEIERPDPSDWRAYVDQHPDLTSTADGDVFAIFHMNDDQIVRPVEIITCPVCGRTAHLSNSMPRTTCYSWEWADE